MATSEWLILRPWLTDIEKERLIADGAWIVCPRGLTLEAQEVIQKRKNQPAFLSLVQAAPGLLTLPSMPIEMAIYPDPGRFFVEESFDQDIARQKRSIAADARLLSKKLGLPNIAEIMPQEVATLTDITFQYFHQTGKWLFGPEYAVAQHREWVYGRSLDPTDRIRGGSWFAFAGGVDRRFGGLRVRDWSGDAIPFVGVMRLVVGVATQEEITRDPSLAARRFLAAA